MTDNPCCIIIIQAFTDDLAKIAASDRDDYKTIAAKTYAKLNQLSELAARFPSAEARQTKRNMKALAATVAAVIKNPPEGQSARTALKKHVAAMAAAFAKVQP